MWLKDFEDPLGIMLRYSTGMICVPTTQPELRTWRPSVPLVRRLELLNQSGCWVLSLNTCSFWNSGKATQSHPYSLAMDYIPFRP